MSEDIFQIWNEVKSMLKNKLTLIQYNTWIRPVKPVSFENNLFTVAAYSDYIENMIKSRYVDDIKECLKFLLKKEVSFKIITKNDEYGNFTIKQNSKENGQQFMDITIEKDSKENELSPILEEKYTFNNFIRGESNELAYESMLAVSDNPGKVYNPLFIYGNSGLGKTHLMKACARKIIEEKKEAKVIYISSEKFTNELIQSIGSKKNEEFREKYRNIDVLLIDDIQFIAGKTGTEEEFFHTFNDLHGANKQIIMSSDKPPSEIKSLEDRLVTRFSCGLIADIQPPNYETKIAILKDKVKNEKLKIDEDVFDYIATNVKSNIRNLEGALIKILARADVKKTKHIDINLAKLALKDIVEEKDKIEITPEFIISIISKKYNIKKEDFKSKSRAKKIAFPRQIAMYLCREHTDLSLIAIAEVFKRDHSTVMHAVNKIEIEMKKNDSFQKDILSLNKYINNINS